MLTTTRGGYPMVSWEYEEEGRVLHAQWDFRDDGEDVFVDASKWSDGTPISDDARRRFYDALCEGGTPPKLWDRNVPVRWTRDVNGYFLQLETDTRLLYMELGRIVRLAMSKGEQLVVTLPHVLRWDVALDRSKPGDPVDVAHREKIRRRIRESTAADCDDLRYHVLHSVKLPIVVVDAVST
jgi:hypothetical protein